MLCKLTNENNETFNNTLWGDRVTHFSSGNGELCSPGWIHYYDNELLAVLLNPIHADFKNPKLWEVLVEGKVKEDFGLKFGTTKLTTIKEVSLPVITLTQKIAFSILCAIEVCYNDKFLYWADNWLKNIDRTSLAAYAAVYEGRKINLIEIAKKCLSY